MSSSNQPLRAVNLRRKELHNLTYSTLRFTDPFPIFELSCDGDLKVYLSNIKNKYYTELKIEGQSIRERVGKREKPLKICIPRVELLKIRKLLLMLTPDTEFNITYDGKVILIRGNITQMLSTLNPCSFALSDYEPWIYANLNDILSASIHSIYSFNARDIVNAQNKLRRVPYYVFEISPADSMRIYDDIKCNDIVRAQPIPVKCINWGFNVKLVRWAIPYKYITLMFGWKVRQTQLCLVSFGVYKSCHIRIKLGGVLHTHILYNCATEIVP